MYKVRRVKFPGEVTWMEFGWCPLLRRQNGLHFCGRCINFHYEGFLRVRVNQEWGRGESLLESSWLWCQLESRKETCFFNRCCDGTIILNEVSIKVGETEKPLGFFGCSGGCQELPSSYRPSGYLENWCYNRGIGWLMEVTFFLGKPHSCSLGIWRGREIGGTGT